MKKGKFLMFVTCLMMVGTLQAQLRLDVEGDAKIRGKLDLVTGNANVFIGPSAGIANFDGFSNTFIGVGAGELNENGEVNTFIGTFAGSQNTSGSQNTFIGVTAGNQNDTGGGNTFIGFDSGYNNNGSNNTFLGVRAGYDNKSGTNNTFVGGDAGGLSDDLHNAIAIGRNAKVGCSDCAVIGEGRINVGIGTTTPSTTLDVNGDATMENIILNRTGNRTISVVPEPNNNADGKNLTIRAGNAFDNNGNGFARDGGDLILSAGNGHNINTPVGGGDVIIRSGANEHAGSPNGGDIIFQTGGPNNTFLEKIRITEAGNMGIGTTTPQQKLHVNGRVRIDNVPIGSGDMLMIDGNGVIVRQPVPRIANLTEDPLIKEQNELLAVKDQEIKELNDRLNKLEQLVQQLAAASTKIPPTNTQISVLTAAQLAQNEPNPFNQSTTIRYSIPTTTRQAILKVTDLNGKIVKSIPITSKGAGETILRTDTLESGQYFYTLFLDGVATDTKKMILNK